MDALHVRDCYTQLRCIRRLLSQLVDDVGDLTIDRSAPELVTTQLGEMQDALSSTDDVLAGFQRKLETLSRGKVA